MDALLDWLLTHGSYALFLGVLLLAGLGMPLPEDVVLIAAGVLSKTGLVNLWIASAVCAFGVLAGDALLFTIARHVGPSILVRRPFRWFLTRERRQRIETLFKQKGGWVVFGARHLAGLRAPVFATAAVHGMPFRKFILWDALGLLVSAPIIIGLGYFFADNIQQVLGDFRKIERLATFLVLIAILSALWFYFKSRAARAETPAE